MLRPLLSNWQEQRGHPSCRTKGRLKCNSQNVHAFLRMHTIPAQRVRLLLFLCAALFLLPSISGQTASNTDQNKPLKALSLEQLGNIEVTSVRKEPEKIWKTDAAIFVITQDDIQGSGATSIPTRCGLRPELKSPVLALPRGRSVSGGCKAIFRSPFWC